LEMKTNRPRRDVHGMRYGIPVGGKM